MIGTILKTKILFNDELAEKMGTEPEDIWGVFWLDLREVAAFGEFVKDGQPNPELTEIIIKNIGGRIINIPVYEFKKKMEKVWGEW